jgi:2-polyprenyl-3-methyl-5-hydroxy-6-metoxy-1,4-benzoquinol methylase
LSKNFEKRRVEDEKVKVHFDKVADEFDNIYENRGPIFTKIINKLFRKAMYERVPITVQESRPLQDKTVLDIGCGSGRVGFLLAKEGARVIGIDYARSMIELAKKYQQQLKVVNNVEFICSDFMNDFPEDKKYDISIALGVFDYIKDPIPFLKKVKKITTNKIIASYPAKFAFQSPLRRMWLSARNCPVFFYTEGELKKIYSYIGTEKIKIIRVPQGALLPDGYVVTSQVN